MTDPQNRNYRPALAELKEYVNNEVFNRLCDEIKQRYKCPEVIEYSTCSMASGWNVKFKSSGKSLCTIYPKEGFFIILLVIGQKEKARTEKILPKCSMGIRNAYNSTRECNNQRWLMIPVEDDDGIFDDILKIIEIRKSSKSNAVK